MAAPSLDIWLYDELVAQGHRASHRQVPAALHRRRVGAVDRRSSAAVGVHAAGPVTYPPGVVGPFLEGLLPEGEARVVLEERYGVRRGDVAGLLGADRT
jgi:HipA-like protein